MISNQINQAFQSRKALICYAPVGDPRFSLDLLGVYRDCGVDIIEIGLPTQDAYADGAVISESMRRVTDAATMDDMIRLTAEIEQKYPALAKIWMCYECADLGSLRAEARRVGLRGLLMVGFDKRSDGQSLEKAIHENDMHRIAFVSAFMKKDEVAAARSASGFIFLQAFAGKTGSRSEDLPIDIPEKIAAMKEAGVSAPIAIGFGISTPGQARQAIMMGADGIITGSACVEAAFAGAEALKQYLSGMRKALDSAEVDAVA